jgi:hypothetical protein
MRRVIAIAAIGVLGLMGASEAVAKQSAQAKAVYAVKEEIGYKWPLLTTVPASLKLPGTRASVACNELSATRFRCTWSARNSLRYRASGRAKVTVYPHGAEATLIDARCEAKYGLRCLG